MDAITLATIPTEARKQLLFWQTHLVPLLGLERGINQALQNLANAIGIPFPTVKRKYLAVRKSGWSAIIDRRICGPQAWNTRASIGLSDYDQQLVKTYCEKYQRKNKTAIEALRRDWRAGKVQTSTAIDPRTGHPRGWTARNLARYVPSDFELAAVRVGRAAASNYRRLVYTTRANLYVGQYYLFDDMWHDHFVNCLDQKKVGRPLEFHALDLKSANKFAWGMRVRTEGEDGKMTGLKGVDMRFLLACILGTQGVHPQGTTLILEHGTAALPEEYERLLYDHSGGLIKCDRSGMEGSAAHAAQYAGRAKGNFRFKAALESLGNLIHNEMAHLPAQTGMDLAHRPEQLHGQLKHNDALLAAMSQLPPERAAMLQWDILTIQQFRVIAEEIYARINARTEHDLEGWDMCYVPDRRTGLPRRMSPAEVWRLGASRLKPLDQSVVALLLADDLATPRRVAKGMIEFSDPEISGDVLRYDVQSLALTEGEKYDTVLNPFRPDELVIFDLRRRWVGNAPRIYAVDRSVAEAVQAACGAAAKAEALALAPLRARHLAEARRKKQMHQHNAEVINGTTPGDRAARRALRKLPGEIADYTEPVALIPTPLATAPIQADEDDGLDTSNLL